FNEKIRQNGNAVVVETAPFAPVKEAPLEAYTYTAPKQETKVTINKVTFIIDNSTGRLSPVQMKAVKALVRAVPYLAQAPPIRLTSDLRKTRNRISAVS